jgi:hypothetical protein
MSRGQGKAIPKVGISNLDEIANTSIGDCFRTLGIEKLNWQVALASFQSGNSAGARLLRDSPNLHSLINEHIPSQASSEFVEQYVRITAKKAHTALNHLNSIKVAGNLKIADFRNIASQSFLEYFFSPFNDRRGGPCRHCGQFWMKKNKRHTIYCSKACGAKHTALASNRKRRRNERENLVEVAMKSVTEWSRSRRKIDWKKWVVSRHPEISKKFLSQLVKNGELVDPVQPKTVRGD